MLGKVLRKSAPQLPKIEGGVQPIRPMPVFRPFFFKDMASLREAIPEKVSFSLDPPSPVFLDSLEEQKVWKESKHKHIYFLKCLGNNLGYIFVFGMASLIRFHDHHYLRTRKPELFQGFVLNGPLIVPGPQVDKTEAIITLYPPS